jgi:excisionase family DNA binding protein
VIGKPIALIQVPNQRLFGTKAAARYLGIHEQTLRKLADLGQVRARQLCRHRVFALEDLNDFIERLPSYNGGGENPRIPTE